MERRNNKGTISACDEFVNFKILEAKTGLTPNGLRWKKTTFYKK
jgi:hypothetical protein